MVRREIRGTEEKATINITELGVPVYDGDAYYVEKKPCLNLIIMKAFADSCYIRFGKCADGREFASIEHYIDIFRDGFTFEDYDFCEDGIFYEDGGWTGKLAIVPDGANHIVNRVFNKLDKKVNECKMQLEQYVKINSVPLESDWFKDAYLYFPMKEIQSQEEDWDEEEDALEGPYFYLVHVTDDSPSAPDGITIVCCKYDFCATLEIKSLDFFIDYKTKSRLISKEVYDYVANRIRELSKEIREEIKKQYLSK